jgi:hypothetical protein
MQIFEDEDRAIRLVRQLFVVVARFFYDSIVDERRFEIAPRSPATIRLEVFPVNSDNSSFPERVKGNVPSH